MILTCDTQGAPGKNKYKPPLEGHVPNPGCTSFSHIQLQGRRTHNPKLQNIQLNSSPEAKISCQQMAELDTPDFIE